MTVYETDDFERVFNKLPSNIRRLFQKQKVIFKSSWLDPRLHTKSNKELPGVYSFRITRRYRVLFYFKDGAAIFFIIGHRKEIYR